MKSFLHTVDTTKSFEAAVEAVEQKVAEKNFRVVNTYDVAASLAEQGYRRGPLKIIEVCNARFASEVERVVLQIVDEARAEVPCLR